MEARNGEQNMYRVLSRFYRQLAEPRNHFASQARVVGHLLAELPNGTEARVLDAACGTGDVLKCLWEAGSRSLYGCDGSEDMLQQVQFDGIRGRVSHVEWGQLDRYLRTHDPFDCIYILGNSLAHADLTKIEGILGSMQGGLSDGGVAIVDVRRWALASGGVRDGSGRADSEWRFLVEAELDGRRYQVSDKACLEGSVQRVMYRFVDAVEPQGTLQEELVYHVFSAKEICELGRRIGFAVAETKVFEEWPYDVVALKQPRNG